MTQVEELDLTIIIVSYCTREMTVACIESVLREAFNPHYEIIVVDNASTDGSAEVIRSTFPNIKLIALGNNIGFARANNVAAKYARGRRILLLNPDTVILDHAIDRLYEFANATPHCRIWGGRTLFPDGRLNPQSCWSRMTLWSTFCQAVGLNLLKSNSLFNSEAYGGWQRDTVRAVDIVVGCFFLIDRPFWEELEGFDPAFFMYGEENDLCLRARAKGAQPMLTPTATIIHYGGATEPDKADQRIKLFAGKLTLMKRHWSKPAQLAGRSLFLLLALGRLTAYGALASLLRRADLLNHAHIWRAVWENRKHWINGWSFEGTAKSDVNLRTSI